MLFSLEHNFDKLVKANRYWILGRAEVDSEFYKVLKAFELCLKHHDGFRNGGEPEAIHQMQMFAHARTMLKNIQNPVTVLILILLHDIIEDPNQKTKQYIDLELLKETFDAEIVRKLLMMSKEIRGVKNEDYSLEAIFADVDCSVAKGIDRANNVSTMIPVFKRSRLERYVTETAEQFLPNIKKARRAFPEQESVYENIKLCIVNQLVIASHVLDGFIPEDKVVAPIAKVEAQEASKPFTEGDLVFQQKPVELSEQELLNKFEALYQSFMGDEYHDYEDPAAAEIWNQQVSTAIASVGLDSLDQLELVMEIEDEYCVRLDDERIQRLLRMSVHNALRQIISWSISNDR
jgi:acyl carrier protein